MLLVQDPNPCIASLLWSETKRIFPTSMVEELQQVLVELPMHREHFFETLLLWVEQWFVIVGCLVPMVVEELVVSS